MDGLQLFISSFLALNPKPSPEQVEQLLFSIGISEIDMPPLVSKVLTASAKRRGVCALTESERVLINDYDPAVTDTDNLLLNDGDNFTSEEKLGNQDALSVDGPVDESSISEFEYNNGRL